MVDVKRVFRLLLCVLVSVSLVSWVACQPGTTPGTEKTGENGGKSEGSAEVTPTDGAPQEQPAPDVRSQPEPSPEPSPEPTQEPTQEPGVPDATPTPEGPPPEPWTSDEPPAPKSYSGETCPTFAAGTVNIKSVGFDRKVEVFLPTTTKGAGLLFLWHGLGDNPANFAKAVSAATLAERGYIVVVPAGVSGPQFPPNVPANVISTMKQFATAMFETWSFFGDPKADLGLFDDVLSCLDQQFDIDNKQVYTSGFSAGALWSTYLTMHRSEYLAASVLFSGGVIDQDLDLSTVPLLNLTGTMKVMAIPYRTPRRKVPVMMTAGGSTDMVSMGGFIKFEFQPATDELGKGLTKDGHFVIQCNHTEGHKVLTPDFNAGLAFIKEHTYGNQPSPFKGQVPSSFPTYCKELQ